MLPGARVSCWSSSLSGWAVVGAPGGLLADGPPYAAGADTPRLLLSFVLSVGSRLRCRPIAVASGEGELDRTARPGGQLATLDFSKSLPPLAVTGVSSNLPDTLPPVECAQARSDQGKCLMPSGAPEIQKVHTFW